MPVLSKPQKPKYYGCRFSEWGCSVVEGLDNARRHEEGHYAKVVLDVKRRVIGLTLPSVPFFGPNQFQPMVRYQCTECAGSFIDMKGLTSHLPKQHNLSSKDFPEIVSCSDPICYGRVDPEYIRQHVRFHKDDSVCKSCSARFRTYSNLMFHQYIWHGETCIRRSMRDSDKCPFEGCERFLSTHQQVSSHFTNCHYDFCIVCGYTSVPSRPQLTRSHIKSHEQNVHGFFRSAALPNRDDDCVICLPASKEFECEVVVDLSGVASSRFVPTPYPTNPVVQESKTKTKTIPKPPKKVNIPKKAAKKAIRYGGPRGFGSTNVHEANQGGVVCLD